MFRHWLHFWKSRVYIAQHHARCGLQQNQHMMTPRGNERIKRLASRSCAVLSSTFGPTRLDSVLALAVGQKIHHLHPSLAPFFFLLQRILYLTDLKLFCPKNPWFFTLQWKGGSESVWRFGVFWGPQITHWIEGSGFLGAGWFDSFQGPKTSKAAEFLYSIDMFIPDSIPSYTLLNWHD